MHYQVRFCTKEMQLLVSVEFWLAFWVVTETKIELPVLKKQHYLCHKTHSCPMQWPKRSATQLQQLAREILAWSMSSFLAAFFLADLQRHHWHKQPWLLHQLFPSSLPPAPSACFSHLYSTCKLRKAHLTVTETLAHSLIFFPFYWTNFCMICCQLHFFPLHSI